MSLNIRRPDDDPYFTEVGGRYSDERAYNVVIRYLEGRVSLEEAGGQLYTMLPNREERETLGGQPGMLSSVLLEIGRQIPYSHPGQMMMVRLIDILKKCCGTAETGFNCDGVRFQLSSWEIRSN